MFGSLLASSRIITREYLVFVENAQIIPGFPWHLSPFCFKALQYESETMFIGSFVHPPLIGGINAIVSPSFSDRT
jgi:hypothetical protein